MKLHQIERRATGSSIVIKNFLWLLYTRLATLSPQRILCKSLKCRPQMLKILESKVQPTVSYSVEA